MNSRNFRRLTVIGGGLAGCEAAWQAAKYGIDVDLYEMRPHRSGPAHVSDRLAELVCSNSLRGAALENAVGLLKAELLLLDSIIIGCAREAAVPAGGALAVDRERFAAAVESRIHAHPRIALHREEVTSLPTDRPTIVACGPLPPENMLVEIDRVLHATAGSGRLHYYDAASPIVAADSIDDAQMYRKSRYDKGDGDDYLNIPLDKERYLELISDLRRLERHAPKAFETDAARGKVPYFEGCLPIEEMADRGEETLRFGPLKPVGLRDPRTGITPYAVVQLRKENVEATAYNLVGFQTRLAWGAQKEAFGKLPGLAGAEWLRLGVMHRNTFIDSPRVLDGNLKLRGTSALYFAGQITGAEGYVEAAACGLMAGIHAAREMGELPPVAIPPETALGAIVAHLQNTQTPDFQPANVTWAPFPPLDTATLGRLGKGNKKERRGCMAERALDSVGRLRDRLAIPLGDFSESRT
ncbi:MAG: methylenetetrahydrofolate--tRNA-(uracil(54)-C(5))-methyltransferase (FADH(2)-oxidizing) TrmFO [Candidatus Eremiobacteraeota bacterium]|nr:methylenetetrahydrofolate--tRNA-(uracil(54)-C(5))-methyltransferase (FADH(2)-oxidizing) TrmFO [Candidatus Eremiobacteraeota bacterium]